ncbi:hypothetical protein LJC64_02490 [Ruminococcaceae bacterium OttesenSCG-928-A11]|nr:hypothetical protein [Ruminococcaceae bacterium OttesenSCG-928-A11]
MPPVPFWRCEKCHREHGRIEDARQCEAAHLEPVSVTARRYTVKPHPYQVDVLFTDGKSRVYNAEDLGG